MDENHTKDAFVSLLLPVTFYNLRIGICKTLSDLFEEMCCDCLIMWRADSVETWEGCVLLCHVKTDHAKVQIT